MVVEIPQNNNMVFCLLRQLKASYLIVVMAIEGRALTPLLNIT
jgi:hypothetical protein